MKTKALRIAAILFCLVLALAACAKKQAPEAEDEANIEKTEKFYTVTADGEGNVVISAAGITETAVFYNYDADGVTVQLVTIRDENGKAHIAFNTCQSCSPSPKAYYTQQGDLLKCANCGFTFAPEEVGVVQGGCNPWPIEKAVFENDRIIIPVSALDEMRGTFASWQGPTE